MRPADDRWFPVFLIISSTDWCVRGALSWLNKWSPRRWHSPQYTQFMVVRAGINKMHIFLWCMWQASRSISCYVTTTEHWRGRCKYALIRVVSVIFLRAHSSPSTMVYCSLDTCQLNWCLSFYLQPRRPRSCPRLLGLLKISSFLSNSMFTNTTLTLPWKIAM